MTEVETPESGPQTPRRRTVALLAGIGLALSGCSSPAQNASQPSGAAEGYDGGCEPFRIIAQNRWSPIGAAIRSAPDILSARIEPGFAGNEVIAVDGWIETTPAYPDNPQPWQGTTWYSLAHQDGWVNSAAVRAEPTVPDPTLRDPYGGEPAPRPSECELTPEN